MRIINSTQIQEEQLLATKIDALICASGFEDRSTHFAKKINTRLANIPLKYCIGFDDKITNERKKNDDFFISKGFELVNGNGDLPEVMISVLELILKQCDSEINIALDYSCMTRVWYAEVCTYFSLHKNSKNISILFCYSYAKFTKAPEDITNNIHVGPIQGFSNVSVPIKPTALIIGLGYEKKRAFGLTEYLDAETFIFYTDDGRAQQFSKEVEKINSEMIEKVGESKVFRYPIDNLAYTEFLLSSLCVELSDKYRIILAPCGPKPFTLVCLVVALKLKNIDVWRISPGKKAEPVERLADGDISVFKLIFKAQ